MPAISTDAPTISAVPAAGNSQDLRRIFAKNRSEQITAIAAKIDLAGSVAFTSV